MLDCCGSSVGTRSAGNFWKRSEDSFAAPLATDAAGSTRPATNTPPSTDNTTNINSAVANCTTVTRVRGRVLPAICQFLTCWYMSVGHENESHPRIVSWRGRYALDMRS